MSSGMSIVTPHACHHWNPVLTSDQIEATLECARVAGHGRTIRVLSRFIDERPQYPDARYTLLSLKPLARLWWKEIVLNGRDAALTQVQIAVRQNATRRAQA